MTRSTFTSFKHAFTMLELIMVIVILGIVASVGSSAIANVYESYLLQRTVHTASDKAELAAMQIANRLTYRISSSVIGRQLAASTPVPLDQVPDDTYKVLEWIGYDNDSFSAQTTPGWSGFSDINDTSASRNNIPTPGSDLSIATTIIGNLGGNTANDLALVFGGHEFNGTINYNATCMGFNNTNCIFTPTISDNTHLDIDPTATAPVPIVVTDQYKLAWSAYALVPVNDDGSTPCTATVNSPCNLELRYNYQPWNGIQSANGSSKILLDNFVSFRFIGKGDTVRFKLCVRERLADQNISICKEKAVIR